MSKKANSCKFVQLSLKPTGIFHVYKRLKFFPLEKINPCLVAYRESFWIIALRKQVNTSRSLCNKWSISVIHWAPMIWCFLNTFFLTSKHWIISLTSKVTRKFMCMYSSFLKYFFPITDNIVKVFIITSGFVFYKAYEINFGSKTS